MFDVSGNALLQKQINSKKKEHGIKNSLTVNEVAFLNILKYIYMKLKLLKCIIYNYMHISMHMLSFISGICDDVTENNTLISLESRYLRTV